MNKRAAQREEAWARKLAHIPSQQRPEIKRAKWYRGYFDKYGLTEKQVDKLLRNTYGKCPICERRFKAGGEPVLDHDHATGKARGFLCNDCNRGLGDFKDKPLVIVRAARYLTGARL